MINALKSFLESSKYVYTSDNMSLKRVVQSVYGQWRLTQAKEVSEF